MEKTGTQCPAAETDSLVHLVEDSPLRPAAGNRLPEELRKPELLLGRHPVEPEGIQAAQMGTHRHPVEQEDIPAAQMGTRRHSVEPEDIPAAQMGTRRRQAGSQVAPEGSHLAVGILVVAADSLVAGSLQPGDLDMDPVEAYQ